jgi:hypothetical protein
LSAIRLLLLVVGFAGCDVVPDRSASAAGEVVEDTIDGKIIVRNGESGLWGPEERWTLHEDWRIGVVEGATDYSFENITNVGIGPHGQIALIDFQAQHVKVFGPTGELLQILGGPGRGPPDRILTCSMCSIRRAGI